MARSGRDSQENKFLIGSEPEYKKEAFLAQYAAADFGLYRKDVSPLASVSYTQFSDLFSYWSGRFFERQGESINSSYRAMPGAREVAEHLVEQGVTLDMTGLPLEVMDEAEALHWLDETFYPEKYMETENHRLAEHGRLQGQRSGSWFENALAKGEEEEEGRPRVSLEEVDPDNMAETVLDTLHHYEGTEDEDEVMEYLNGEIEEDHIGVSRLTDPGSFDGYWLINTQKGPMPWGIEKEYEHPDRVCVIAELDGSEGASMGQPVASELAVFPKEDVMERV